MALYTGVADMTADSSRTNERERRGNSSLSLLALCIVLILLISAIGAVASTGRELPGHHPVQSSAPILSTEGSGTSLALSDSSFASPLPSSSTGGIIKNLNYSTVDLPNTIPLQGVYVPSTGLIYSGAISYTIPWPAYLIEANTTNSSLSSSTIPLQTTAYALALDNASGNLTVVESNVDQTNPAPASEFVQQFDPVTGVVSTPLNMSLSPAGFPANALYDPVNSLVYILTTNFGPGQQSNLSVYNPQSSQLMYPSLIGMFGMKFYPVSMAFNGNYSRLFISGSILLSGTLYEIATLAVNMSNYSYYLIKTPVQYLSGSMYAGGIAYDPYDGLMYFSYSSSVETSTTPYYATEWVGIINASTEAYVLNFSMPNVIMGFPGMIAAGGFTYNPANNDLYLAQAGLSWEAPSNHRTATNSTIAVINGTSATAANPIGMLNASEYAVGGTYVPSQTAGAGGSLWFPYYGTNGVLAFASYGGYVLAGIAPVVSSFTASPSTIDEGSEVTLSASVDWGVGALSYAYAGLPAGMSTQNTSVLTGIPTASGSYTVTLTVMDAAGETATASVPLNVNPAMSATVASTSDRADTGQVVQFFANVSGGTSPYAVQWAFGDGASGSGPAPLHAFNASGDYQVTATVTDALGTVTTANMLETVSLPPSNLTISVSRSVTDAGVPVTFSAQVQFGGGNVTYQWSMGNGNTATGNPLSYAYPSQGTYRVSLKAVDSSGGSASASYSITVMPDPHAAIVLSPTKLSAGGNATFGSNVTGGTGPYAYLWSFGDGQQSTQPSPQHAYRNVGNYTVTLKVTDAAGYIATGTLNVTVATAAGSTGGSGTGSGPSGVNQYLMLGAGLAAGLVIGAVVVAVIMSRRKSPPAGKQ